MTTLIRQRISPSKTFDVHPEYIDPIDEDILKLAEKSKSELGYSHLLENLIKTKKTEKTIPTANYLADIDVYPFDEKSVNEYKEQKCKEALDNIPQDIPPIYIKILTVIGILLFWGHTFYNPAKIQSACFFTVMAIPLFIDKLWIKKTHEAKWSLILLSEYKKPVPEFVLNTALEIKKKFPNAILQIDELSLEEINNKSNNYTMIAPLLATVLFLDPFLVATIDGKEYWVEVWNEPNFKENKVS
jgi:hypothetical protein